MSDYREELKKMEEERYAQEYSEAEAQAYKNGWNDAIDEMMKECKRFRNQFKAFYYGDFVRIAEQLKEQKNG